MNQFNSERYILLQNEIYAFFHWYFQTRHIWNELCIKVHNLAADRVYVSEQHLLEELIQKHKPNVKWLEIKKFPFGLWYTDTKYEDTKQDVGWLGLANLLSGLWYRDNKYQGVLFRDFANKPLVIQNNYIMGNHAKISRAKRWHHWFYNEYNNSCLHDISHSINKK